MGGAQRERRGGTLLRVEAGVLDIFMTDILNLRLEDVQRLHAGHLLHAASVSSTRKELQDGRALG